MIKDKAHSVHPPSISLDTNQQIEEIARHVPKCSFAERKQQARASCPSADDACRALPEYVIPTTIAVLHEQYTSPVY
jgi:hypothetical protein